MLRLTFHSICWSVSFHFLSFPPPWGMHWLSLVIGRSNPFCGWPPLHCWEFPCFSNATKIPLFRMSLWVCITNWGKQIFLIIGPDSTPVKRDRTIAQQCLPANVTSMAFFSLSSPYYYFWNGNPPDLFPRLAKSVHIAGMAAVWRMWSVHYRHCSGVPLHKFSIVASVLQENAVPEHWSGWSHLFML